MNTTNVNRRLFKAWSLIFVAVLIGILAYRFFPTYFNERGWVGLIPFGMGILFFFDVLRGATIGIGYWRLPPKPSRLVFAWGFVLAIAATAFGLAVLFRPVL